MKTVFFIGLVIFFIGVFIPKSWNIGENGSGEYVFSPKNTVMAIGFLMCFMSPLLISIP